MLVLSKIAKSDFMLELKLCTSGCFHHVSVNKNARSRRASRVPTIMGTERPRGDAQSASKRYFFCVLLSRALRLVPQCVVEGEGECPRVAGINVNNLMGETRTKCWY